MPKDTLAIQAEQRIPILRDQKVMLDFHLAELYGVKTHKGHFQLANGLRCHALTVLDDPSRYNLVLRACPGETRDEVQRHRTEAFMRHGLPRQIFATTAAHGEWGCATTDRPMAGRDCPSHLWQPHLRGSARP
jgi:hypothetical protein